MHIAPILLPTSADALDQLRSEVEQLRTEGHRVTPRLTFEGGDAERFAAEAVRAGADLVVAAGGDGTINEVANGLLGAGGSGSLPHLGLVPLGTGNDLASALQVPTQPGEALRACVRGVPHAVDVGEVNGRIFLNVSTGGFGAEATEETGDDAKHALGAFAYLITGARKFVGLDPAAARFTAGEVVLHDGPFLVFAVGNSGRTGGGNWLTPRAQLHDGLLDVCIVRAMPRLDFVRILPALRSGSHLDHPEVVYAQVRALEVQADRELTVNADGQPLHGTHFSYRVHPGRLTIRLPEGASLAPSPPNSE